MKSPLFLPSLFTTLLSFIWATPSVPAAPGLYALHSDSGNLTIVTLSPVSGNVTRTVTGSHAFSLPTQLVTVDPLTTLVWMAVAVESTNLVAIDLTTAEPVYNYVTSYPITMIEGTGQQIGYFSSTKEVVFVGNLNGTDYYADHIVTAYASDGSAKNRTVGKPIPGKPYYMFLGNLAASSNDGTNVTTDVFNFLYRNGPRNLASFTVNAHGDGTTSPQVGCEMSSMGGYDHVTNSFIGLGVYRNGTTIKNVYIAVTSTPADGSGPCTYNQIVLDEGTWSYGAIVDSLTAFDMQNRKLYAYTASGVDPTDPTWLVEIDMTNGKPRLLQQFTVAEIPDALVYVPPRT